MRMSSINGGHRFLLKILFINWVLLMTESFGVASFLHVVVTWENLCERVLHFHFTVEGSGHVSFWAKRAIMLQKLSSWRILVMVSIIWQLCFPVTLKSIWSCWPHEHTFLFAEVMHHVLVLLTAIILVVNIL